jgi:hypothetical protein
MTSSQPSPQEWFSAEQSALPTAAPLTRVDPEMRRAKLALAVQQEVIAGGRVESQTEFTAIVRYEKPVNNVLCTCCLRWSRSDFGASCGSSWRSCPPRRGRP